MTRRPTLLIAGALVLPLDADDRPRPDHDIRVVDGRIDGVGPRGSFDHLPADRVIDARRTCAIPGLVNAHTHSPAAFARGTVDRDDHPHFMWRNQADTVGRTPEEIYTCTLLAAIEMLRTGTTSVVDHYPEQPFAAAAVEPVVRAYRDVGMRAAIALRVYDEPYYDILPPATADLPDDLRARLGASPLAPPSAEAQLELCRDVIERWHRGADGTVTVMIAPSAPMRCSDAFLRGVVSLAKEHGTGLHTHLLETPVADRICRERHGTSLLRRMQALGMLGPRLSCAHGIHVTDDDIALLADSGTTVVHNPVSNLRIGDGIAPVLRMHRRGVPIALGTDGASTNDNLNLFEEVKLAAILHRCGGEPMHQWISDAEALRMATRGGARALGEADSLGSIAAGRRADLVLFDLDTLPFTPLNDPLRQLVYSACGRGVHTVVVDGRVVIDAGRVATVDERAVLRAAREQRTASRERNAALYEFADALSPYVGSGR